MEGFILQENGGYRGPENEKGGHGDTVDSADTRAQHSDAVRYGSDIQCKGSFHTIFLLAGWDIQLGRYV